MNTENNACPANTQTSAGIIELTTEEKLKLAIDLTHSEGFDKWFQIVYNKFGITQFEAFEMICFLFSEVVGRDPIYSNFQSYRRSRNYRTHRELKRKS